MTLSDFLNHWSITENPFRGEEARDDSVFARMSGGHRSNAVKGGPAIGGHSSFHSDFEKILGDLARPSTSIVFGEKGSGKTAIRLQINARVNAYNVDHPNAKVLLIAYDDLNAWLGRLHERVGGKTPLESFQSLRLVDHIDSMLGMTVPRLVDALLGVGVGPGTGVAGEEPLEIGADAKRACRRLDTGLKRDVMILQAVYDRSGNEDGRAILLRRRLGVWRPMWTALGDLLVALGPVVVIAFYVWGRFFAPDSVRDGWLTPASLGLLALYMVFAVKHAVWDRMKLQRDAKRVRKQLRVSGRSASSYFRSLRRIGESASDGALPLTDSDETRYAMLARLRRVASSFGYSGMLIVVDRVDEPTLVSGDPDRMRAIVWPMLNNKFLQQDGVGVKLLLPVELRHALFKESSAFFQDARLDKQNFVDRLTWTGPMLYDLCDARLQACRLESAPPMSLLDLFAEDVTRQDVVDALDQMHQPRDAFKFLYRCIGEHTSGVTRDQSAWKIPRLVLDHIRKQEAERVQQLHRGIRPA